MDAKEQRRDPARQCGRGNESEEASDRRENQALPNNQRSDRARLRAQSKADADFAAPLGDHVGVRGLTPV